MPEPTTERRRTQLRIEPVASDDNFEQQLIASLERIHDGLSGIHELLERVIDPGTDETPGRVRTETQ